MSCRTLSHFGVNVNQEALDSDLVPIAEAEAEFGMSLRSLQRLIATEGITKVKRPGDRRHFVSRAEVTKHLGFKEVR